MKFDDFTEIVREKLQTMCEAGESVKVCTVLKNNSKKMTGVIIRKHGSDVCPTVYLENYYEEYCDGSNIDSVVEEIFRISKASPDTPKFSLDRFRDWDYMKNQILCKLINTGKNEEFLSGIPNREFLDLSIVYYIRVDNSMDAYATTVIHNEHMKIWNVTEKDLYDCAQKNNGRILPGKVTCMNQVLCDILGSDVCEDSDTGSIIDELVNADDMEMFVATNSDSMYGASVMLDQEILKNFAKIHGSFYILPSSIHELIFIPDNPKFRPEELLDMVRNVNRTEVDEVDVLSDNVYFYDPDSEIHLKLIK